MKKNDYGMGLRKIAGYLVWIENGKISHGYSYLKHAPIYVYRAGRAWYNRGWWREYDGVTVAAFRAGVRRGTIMMS